MANNDQTRARGETRNVTQVMNLPTDRVRWGATGTPDAILVWAEVCRATPAHPERRHRDLYAVW